MCFRLADPGNRPSLAHATRAQGAINSPSAHPRIGFGANDGRTYEFVQNGFFAGPFGASVPVAYQAENPRETARAATFWSLWGEAIWTLIPGAAFLLLPLFGVAFKPGRF